MYSPSWPRGVRLLASGAVNKNDPNDARSVAIAALRSPSCLPVRPDDHAAVLKIWAKRHRDLSRARTQVACRLHAALCELVPGGISTEICAAHAARVLEQAEPGGAVQQARAELAAELTADLRRIDAQLRETRNKPAAAIRACGSTLRRLGPMICPRQHGRAGIPGTGERAEGTCQSLPRRTASSPGTGLNSLRDARSS